MRAVCAFNQSSMLSDHQRGRLADLESTYPLTVGHEYCVLGMIIFENVLSFLVPDDLGGPCFAPGGLFELGDHNMPGDWKFALREGTRASGRELWTHPLAAVWGYEELVTDTEHVAALAERRPEALDVFSARRRSVEHALSDEEQ